MSVDLSNSAHDIATDMLTSSESSVWSTNFRIWNDTERESGPNTGLAGAKDVTAKHFGDCCPQAIIVGFDSFENVINFVLVQSLHFSSS